MDLDDLLEDVPDNNVKSRPTKAKPAAKKKDDADDWGALDEDPNEI
jgi:hypothetical protein